jgi:hypothetical protein
MKNLPREGFFIYAIGCFTSKKYGCKIHYRGKRYTISVIQVIGVGWRRTAGWRMLHFINDSIIFPA